MKNEEKEKLVNFLRANIDVFAWHPYNMSGIDAKVMCHRLHIDKNFKPVKQKPRRGALEKARAIEEEVHKLFKARTIRETQFPEWISNQL